MPPRPEEVKIAISNSTTLSVSWKRFTLVELKGLASYVITYRATSESSAQANNAIISVPWTQNYTVVTGLSPVVEYNIAVSTATMNQMSGIKVMLKSVLTNISEFFEWRCIYV